MPVSLSRVRALLRGHGRRGATFLVVGAIGAVVDLGVFNILVYWGGHGPMNDQPVTARVIATISATVATYIGNALLTYRDHPTRMSSGRIIAYAAINGVAIAIQSGCLAVSRYGLGLEGPVADNISGSVVGLVLATAFRYVAYPRWVFVASQDVSIGRQRS